MNRYKKGWKAMAAYTALFLVWLAACHGVLIGLGRSLVWEVDGLMQHYTFSVYVGQWVREAVGAVLTGAPVPMFDFALGVGEDVLKVLNYYGLGDPVMMLSALFTGANTELGYTLIMILLCWLAGASCIALCRNRGLSWKQAIAAGVIYAFNVTLFKLGTTGNAMFANPYYQFPLMLLGLEHVFAKKKPWLLSLATALSALCGFYFLYVNSVLLLIYALIRHFTMGHERPLRTLPATAGRAIGWFLLGIGLSAVVFLPVTLGFLLTAQRGAGNLSLNGLNWRYALRNYLDFPLSMLTTQSTSGVPFMPTLVMLSAALLLIRWKKAERSWRALMIASMLLLATPATGYALNGFSYATNRWTYAVHLLLAMTAGKMLPELFRMTRRERILLALFGAAMMAHTAARWMVGARSGELLLMTALLLVALVCVLVVSCRPRLVRIGALGLVVTLLAGMSAAYWYTARDKQDQLIPVGECYEMVMDHSLAEISQSDGLQRIDSDIETAELFNASALAGRRTTSVYNSLISGTFHGFLMDVADAGLVHVNAVAGLDHRAALEALWSVDRYVIAQDSEVSPPYGFEQVSEGLWENKYALTGGFALMGAISMEEYEALSPLEKQWALLQCAVLDDAAVGHAEITQSVTELEVLDIQMENIHAEGDRLEVEEDAVIRVTFDAPADCELYVELEKLAFADGLIDQNNRMTLKSGDAATEICLMPEGFFLEMDRDSYLVNIGYDDEARATAEIRFARTGNYRLAGIKLYVQPMENFPEMVGALQERSLENVQVGANAVTGTVELDEPAVMVFSIPYSTGWTIEVDGRKAEAISSAGTFLACEMDAGSHEVRLRYETPWLKVGCIISVVSLVGLAAAIHAGRRRSQKGEAK